jgi:hypothetical protein
MYMAMLFKWKIWKEYNGYALGIELGKFIKERNESSHRKGVDFQRSDVVRGFYPFSPGYCSISMLIRYVESSILVGCACNILIGHALVFMPSLF